VVKKVGNTLSFGDQKLGVGLENSRQFLKINQPLVKKISDLIKKKSLDKSVEMVPVTTES
jgi:hypothetical protein